MDDFKNNSYITRIVQRVTYSLKKPKKVRILLFLFVAKIQQKLKKITKNVN